MPTRRTRFIISYLHVPINERARFYPMSKVDAVEVAKQLAADGEAHVKIEDAATGETWSPEAFEALA